MPVMALIITGAGGRSMAGEDFTGSRTRRAGRFREADFLSRTIGQNGR